MSIVNFDPIAALIKDCEFRGMRVSFRGRTYNMKLRDAEVACKDFIINFSDNIQCTGMGYISNLPCIEIRDRYDFTDMSGNDYPILSYSDIAKYYESFQGIKNFGKTDVKLKEIYNYFNENAFNNELPYLLPVFYNSRLTRAAGHCKCQRRYGKVKPVEICISPYYIEKHPDELKDVLCHEMIHAKNPDAHHNYWFVHIANEMNKQFGLNISVHSAEASCARYVYQCPICKDTWERSKRISEGSLCPRCRTRLVLLEDKGVMK